MNILRALFGEPPPTDYELQDGSGVFRDPETGHAYAGTVEPDGPRGTDWVWPHGDAPPAPPEDWGDQIVREWRS